MFFSAVGMMTAMWLVISPLLGVDTGFRAGLAVAIGIVAMILAPLGLWSPAARRVVVWAGLLLAFVNFVVPGTVLGMANFAACGSFLIIGALAPQPVVEVPVVATAHAPVKTEAHAHGRASYSRMATAA